MRVGIRGKVGHWEAAFFGAGAVPWGPDGDGSDEVGEEEHEDEKRREDAQNCEA